jgi:hypothetical protein
MVSRLAEELWNNSGTEDRMREYLQKRRMRIFNVMVVTLSQLSILYGLSALVIENVKGSRPAFFPISTHLVFKSLFFPTASGVGVG